MDKLSSLSAASPETRTVDLSNSGITSLDGILPVLAKLPRLHTLDLEKNELIALPKDLSRLARLQRLDVSQNPFASVQQILPGLQSIPLLEVLFVDVDGEEDRSALLAALPQLIQLNNEPVKLQEVLEVEDAPADAFLDKVNKVADKIRKLRVGRENFREERLKARLSELTADLESKRALPSDSLQNKRSIALTKRAFVICLKETLRPLLEPAAQSLAQDLETLDGELFEELSEVVLALAPASPLRSARRMEEAASEQSDSSTEQVPGTPNRQKPNAELLENISLKTKVENLETELFEATSKLQEKSACEAQLMRQMTSLLGAQKALEVELKGYQDLLQRERSKTSDLEALLFDSQRAPDSVVKAKDAKNSADLRRTEDLTLLYRSVSNERLRKSHAVSLRGSTVGDGRGISFKHILVTIVDVYQSKEKSDARNREMHQPLETLAEHLQNYLNKKYGLKSLRERCSKGLFCALDSYSTKDCDVKLFSYLLENKVEEGYRLVHEHFKGKVLAYLRDVRTNGAKKRRLEDSEKGVLTLGEAKTAIRALFAEEDREVLQSVLQEYVQQNVLRGGDFFLSRPATKDSRLPVDAFMHVLLEYRLQQHIELITPFLFAFQRVDVNKDGRVTLSEFREMLRDLTVPLSEEATLALLKTVDPDNLQEITLSQCAEGLSEQGAEGERYLELFRR